MENYANAHGDAWLVYDGECPVCNTYTKYVRIRETIGRLHLVNARHPSALLDEVTAAGLDIDHGMVLKFNGVIYYGSDAAYVLTMLGSPSGLFNRINYAFFGSKIGASIFYPLGKACRTALLRLLGIKYIENLKHAKSTEAK